MTQLFFGSLMSNLANHEILTMREAELLFESLTWTISREPESFAMCSRGGYHCD